jgi:LAS superfamily LD-carboxypeptidase LdcB
VFYGWWIVAASFFTQMLHSSLLFLAQGLYLVEWLRADAAEAFLGLDEDYREHFGQAMCVGDSYRPLSEQVRLFEESRPGMAARPGTSAHGRGVAVDLCGGVEELGTPEHEWMLDNAPDHGWDNPPWARDGFEPWHWEYEG